MTKHFGQFRIKKTASGYEVEFENKDTGEEVVMTIPERGIFECDPKRDITQDEVRELAEQIADVLDSYLD